MKNPPTRFYANKQIKPVLFALNEINIHFIFAYIRFKPNIAAYPRRGGEGVGDEPNLKTMRTPGPL